MSAVETFTLQVGTDISTIDQFGAGFYSAYLATDKFQVISKSNYDEKYLWESSAVEPFTIKNDNSEPIGRGTIIMPYMKEDRAGYLNGKKMKEINNQHPQLTVYATDLVLKKEQRKQISEEYQKPHERNSE